MLGSLVGVHLFLATQSVINQIGTLTSYVRCVVTGTFLIVAVAARSCLNRMRTY